MKPLTPPQINALAESVGELAVALRDTLHGYPVRELSRPPAELYARALAALKPIETPAEWEDLATTLKGRTQ